MSRARGLSILEVLVVIVVLGILVTLLAPALLKTRHRSGASKCANNLKQIALSAIQYADERGGLFPHIAPLRALDGGGESSTAAQCIRALTHYNYCDNPELYVCPDSPDQLNPLTDAARADIRRFAWGGNVNDADLAKSPLYEGKSAHDLPLAKLEDLSYAWTRRGLTTSSRSAHVVAGDRATPADGATPPGNHRDRMQVAHVDGHVSRITREGDGLTLDTIASIDSAGGFLGTIR